MLSSKRGNKLYHPFWYVITFQRFKQENDNSKGRLILIRLFGLFSITTRRVEDSYGGSWFMIQEDIEVRNVKLNKKTGEVPPVIVSCNSAPS